MTEDRQQCNQLKKLTEENGIRLQTELDVLKRELDERHNELKKERMRIEKFIRQEEVTFRHSRPFLLISLSLVYRILNRKKNI